MILGLKLFGEIGGGGPGRTVIGHEIQRGGQTEALIFKINHDVKMIEVQAIKTGVISACGKAASVCRWKSSLFQQRLP